MYLVMIKKGIAESLKNMHRKFFITVITIVNTILYVKMLLSVTRLGLIQKQ